MDLLSSLSTFFYRTLRHLSFAEEAACSHLDINYTAHFLPTKVYLAISVSFQSRLLLRKKTPPDATAGDART